MAGTSDFPIELDIASTEINSNMWIMIDHAIEDAVKFRTQGIVFPPLTIGALYYDLLDAYETGVGRLELRKKMLNIMDNTARAMLQSVGADVFNEDGTYKDID